MPTPLAPSLARVLHVAVVFVLCVVSAGCLQRVRTAPRSADELTAEWQMKRDAAAEAAASTRPAAR